MKLPSCLEEAVFHCKKVKYSSSRLHESMTRASAPGEGLWDPSERAGGRSRSPFTHTHTHSLIHSRSCPELPMCARPELGKHMPSRAPAWWAQPVNLRLRAGRVPTAGGTGLRKPSLGASGQASWRQCPLRTRRALYAGEVPSFLSLPIRAGPLRLAHTPPTFLTPAAPTLGPLLPNDAVGTHGPEHGAVCS